MHVKLAVFVDGCFWHGHGCRNCKPSENRDYWMMKIKRTKERDDATNKRFRDRDWHVIRVWECELRKKDKLQALDGIKQLLRAVAGRGAERLLKAALQEESLIIAG